MVGFTRSTLAWILLGAMALAACGGSDGGGAATQPPEAPTGLTASAGSGTVALSWSAMPGATSYSAYRATSSGALSSKTKIGTVTTTDINDASVVDGTQYFYQVTASNPAGESAGSSEVFATPSSSALPLPFIQARVVRWTLSAKPGGVPIQEVRICTDATCSTRVAGATVRVNSTTLGWDLAEEQYVGNVMPAENYTVTLTVTIPAGSTVAAGTYTATAATYASAPVVTMPTSSTTWSRSSAHDLTWTAGAPTSTTPESVYVVAVNDSSGNFYPVKPDGSPAEVPVGSTTYTLPANALPAAGTYIAWIAIGTTGIAGRTPGGIAIPGAAAGSALYVGYASAYVAFTVTN